MAKLTVEERLDVAVKHAAADALANQTSREIAESLYESEREMVEHFARAWVIEKLSTLVRQQRLQIRAADDPQLQLGFSVPKTIVLRTGKRLPIGDATLRKLRQYRAMLWKEKRDYKHPAVAKLDQAIELMKKYAAEERGITWGDVVTQEAAKKAKVKP